MNDAAAHISEMVEVINNFGKRTQFTWIQKSGNVLESTSCKKSDSMGFGKVGGGIVSVAEAH